MYCMIYLINGILYLFCSLISTCIHPNIFCNFFSLDNEQRLFYFQVKFYPPEPSLLQEELTRYQLTLQIRQDIYTGKLPCSWVTQALLGSFMVQAELGDFDPDKHIGLDYLNEFEFVPSPTPQLLKKIVELHKTHT